MGGFARRTRRAKGAKGSMFLVVGGFGIVGGYVCLVLGVLGERNFVIFDLIPLWAQKGSCGEKK